MVVTATIFEAKTKLSELVRRAQSGEHVVITSGRERVPVAELTPLRGRPKKRLGVRETPGFEIGDAFWKPLPPGWDGATEAEEDVL